MTTEGADAIVALSKHSLRDRMLSDMRKIVRILRTFPSGIDRNIPRPFPLLSMQPARCFST
jgi:hypothetical protein